MKRKITIVINHKHTCKMGERNKMAADCVACFDEIQKTVDDVIKKIDDDFDRQRTKMSDEWVKFLSGAEEKLNNSITHSEKETNQLNTNSKWILTIVLGITFALGAAVGLIYSEVSSKANRKEVLTLNETKILFDLTKAYNAAQFLQNPDAKVDSTNYKWLVDKIFSGTMRGSE